jgi:hypothetical protein
MIFEQDVNIPGIVFHHGIDATADLLNAQQGYLSAEVTGFMKNMMKYPGFSWGMRVLQTIGQNITIAAGVGIDRFGARLYHAQDASYGIIPPVIGSTVFYLCVRAVSTRTSYKVHPYNWTRRPTEEVIGIEFFSENTYSTDIYGNIYPSSGNGLVVAKITISGTTYMWNDVYKNTRSPNLKMKNGL